MKQWIDDDRARVPFVAIGVLMLLISSVVTVFLLSTEARIASAGTAEDAERDLSPALTLALSDIGSALNYAGMYAESEVGMTPVINASPGSRPGESPEKINEDRIRSLTYRQLAAYLESNYRGNFQYGDYSVTARIDGDQSSIQIIPCNMTLTRNLDHPVLPCQRDYTAYYILTVPVRLTVSKKDSDFTYTETKIVRALITSRYPLLQGMTEEYAERLNDTAMFADLTAASYAYTWARGYSQYFLGMPLNIVDNGDMALMANGANLLEQGYTFNSVDPLSLASLVYYCSGAEAHPSSVTNYSVLNTSKKDLPGNASSAPPRQYNFTIDDIVDRAYHNVTFGGYAESCYSGAYRVYMFLDATRERDYYTAEGNRTGIVEEPAIIRQVEPFCKGYQVPLTRTFRVYGHDANSIPYADRVTVNYVLSRYSSIEFYGAGKYMDSAERLDDPLLQPAFNDIQDPCTPLQYQKDLSFGRKAFTDNNLKDLIRQYEGSFDGPEGRFEENLLAAMRRRGDVNTLLPYGYTNPGYSFICGPGNNRPVWMEIEADYELKDLCQNLRQDIHVTLDPEEYGGSPAAMSSAAYAEMLRQFEEKYPSYLDQPAYATEIAGMNGSKQLLYRSCGSKAIFYVRRALLEDVRAQLDRAAGLSGDQINRTLDSSLSGTGLNSSDITTGAAQSRNYLDNNFYIQFGLPMTLNSSPEAAGGYPWKESVTLAIDQSPHYLYTDRYTDPETGYTTRPLKLRNICLFSLPAGFLDTEELSEAMAGPLLDCVDAMANSAIETGNETLVAETGALIDQISAGTKVELKKQIAQKINADPEAGDSISQADIDRAVDDAYARRGNNTTLIVEDLKNGQIGREVADDLIDASAEVVKKKAQEKADGYADEYTDYVSRRIREQVQNAEREAIRAVVDSVKGQVKGVINDFTQAAAEKVVQAGTEAAIGQAMSKIPSGIPLLPPYGWWATMNVWYIEVQGDIPYLTVYDADNEAVPNPIFGHEAPCYTRRWQTVTGPDGTLLGRNEPIRFCVKTSTFILVPPGPQGVGDKSGEWDEKSEGFEEAPTWP
ncbi:DUF7286 family protein [Methanocella arvoryzae]|uniref:Uncharacterized protein n=1 Tax=Methanocella arvoryzae (strain DSM 22066 / NBRC 105507 / MRE50) TaxID=351160 RepID=Q0W758_METAR|nr:hypothetical protein [Methanocella arvoryzae]CAJ35785.1 hypothetical protein RCIX327 [Methanocella arvoryzae MRE50]